MKSLLGMALVAILTTHLSAQSPKPKDTKSQRGYALGHDIGKDLKANFKRVGVELDSRWIARGLLDAFLDKKALTDGEMQVVLKGLREEITLKQMPKEMREKVTANLKKGREFLAANKAKPGVKTTASGLQYSVIKAGTGKKPARTDQVKVHYHGTLIDGTVFDSSVERKKPAQFPVYGVIPGWVEALQLMPTGAKWKLFIPYDLAYGFQARSKIPAGSVLVFEVELLEIVAQTPPPKFGTPKPPGN